MNNSRVKSYAIWRVMVLLLAGMASGLVVADAMDEVNGIVSEFRETHGPLLHFNTTQALSAKCGWPRVAAKSAKAAYSLLIG